MPTFHNDTHLAAPLFPGSHMATDDRYVFVSGLTVEDIPEGAEALGDIAAETHCVMSHLERMLGALGASLASVIRVDVHLTDMDEIGVMDGVYAKFFETGHYPTRTCTVSPQLYGKARVEITVMARHPD